MNTPKSDYLLLFRGPDWDKNLSQGEAEQVLERMMSWFEGLNQQGVVKGGRRTVADGPFAESKEAVGGYLVVQVKRMDEAVAMARACPTLDYGIDIEVRPVLEECPCFQRVRERQALATA